MKYDYYKGDMRKAGITPGGLSKKEEEARALVTTTLKEANLNAEENFFGVLFYYKGVGFKLVISEDG